MCAKLARRGRQKHSRRTSDLIKARVQRERKELPGKEELEAFHKWQDDQ